MNRLVYVSVATKPFSVDDLAHLLVQSRAANAQADITGILLYKDGAFLQVLEGDADRLRQMFDRILADDRHTDVKKIVEEPIVQRDFPDWSMGFENLTESTVQGLDGYTDVFGAEQSGRSFFADLERLRQFIMLFYPSNRSQAGV